MQTKGVTGERFLKARPYKIEVQERRQASQSIVFGHREASFL
jgi:hypothetical protein